MSKPILLMNHTLLSKKSWCQTAPDSYIKGSDETWKQKAYRELAELLCRTPYQSNEAAERGIKFENRVYANASSGRDEGSEELKMVVNMVRGGVFQKFVTKDVELSDVILRWYGILDVKFRDKIIDIKTTAKFKPSSYVESGQDRLYKWLTGIEEFEYVVAEWDEFPKIKRIEVVQTPREDLKVLEGILIQQAKDYLEWLKDLGYYDLYVDCYCHKGKGWKSMIAKKGPNQEAELEAFYQPFRDKFLAQFTKEEF